MGMNNWGGMTEHMTKKPRAVFSYRTRNRIKRTAIDQKFEFQINEKEILKKKNKKLLQDLLIWYGIPFCIPSGICFTDHH